jgi:hypothetical protein
MLMSPIVRFPQRYTATTWANLPFDAFVQALVAYFQSCPGKSHKLIDLHDRCRIKRRRLYDVINILIVLGAANGLTAEEFFWLGEEQIYTTLIEQKQTMNIMNPEIPLSVLFPQENCVSFTTLTMSILMMFPAIGTERLNLREISAYFSRNAQRFKTTICKLYQITLILGALRIMQRTENRCEVKIIPPYTFLLMNDTFSDNPMAISRLLNRPNESANLRKNEFEQICQQRKAIQQ